MDLEFDPSTELQKRRAAYFAQLAKPGMTMGEFITVNTEVLRKFPVAAEERQQKFEGFRAMPEFVL